MAVVLETRKKDLDGFSVRRILPQSKKTMVGPFIFVDHMGPAEFNAGEGIDVRPHPHIGLATLTYMLEGSLLHRDSLGNHIEITPGDVNWMTAGKGIVHSERETHEVKASQHRLNGMQCWMALPKAQAEIAPAFTHIKREKLPHAIKDGVFMRLIAGEIEGLSSPIHTYSPMFYLDILAEAGANVKRPQNHCECMLYILMGELRVGGVSYAAGTALILEDESDIEVLVASRILMLGGEQWPEVPHIEWNFVSFSRERIEQAKQDWRDQRFPKIPGDDLEYTPLPGDDIKG